MDLAPEQIPLRQRQVAALIASGATNAEIARRLGLTRNTVGGHLNALFARLALRSRLEVAQWARAHGLSDDNQG